MKLKLIYLVVFLLSLNIVIAQIDVNLFREEYSSLETLQAEITFLETPSKSFLPNDIKLTNNETEIKVPSIIIPLEENKYHIYFNLPNLQYSKYNLSIESLFIVNNILKEITIDKEFNVIETDSLTINPPIFKINNILDSYSVSLKNNKNNILNVNINLVSDFIYSARDSITLNPNEQKNLILITKEGLVEDTILTLNYGTKSYTIPIIIEKETILEKESQEEIILEIEKASFLASSPDLEKTLNKDQAISGSLDFQNNLNKDLIVRFSLSNNLKEIVRINISQAKLKPNEINSQYLWINEKKNPSKNSYEGFLTLQAEDYKEEFPIKITFTEEETIDIEETEDTEEFEEETFEVESLTPTTETGIDSIINFSAPQEEKQKTSSNTFQIISVIIIFILLLIIFYFLKIKPSKKTFNQLTKK
tara:strand:- start:8920 stop:10182 length:1263 start_codon:yes stop_codon:yes gene_type:complete